MHIRVAHDTCVRVQVVFNAIPAAEEFLTEIRQRDDVFLVTSSAAMVFFYTFNERQARNLAMDFERRWLERLIASSTPATVMTPSAKEVSIEDVGTTEEKPVKKSSRAKAAEESSDK